MNVRIEDPGELLIAYEKVVAENRDLTERLRQAIDRERELRDIDRRRFEKPLWMIAWDRFWNRRRAGKNLMFHCTYHKGRFNPDVFGDCPACVQRIARDV